MPGMSPVVAPVSMAEQPVGVDVAPGHRDVADLDLVLPLVEADVVADADLRQDDAEFLGDLVPDRV